MLQTLIGQKIDQTQTFLENGKRIPVTEVLVADNVVVQVKTDVKDNYTAVQLGFGTKKHPINALAGHSKKAGLESAPSLLREVAWHGNEELPQPGDLVSVESVFQPGDLVKVTGTSKGKGFAGGVKRFHFRGGPKTHGQSDRHRAPGSIGQGTTPGRVYKGKKMAGHMGVDTVTVSNLIVVDVDPENKKLYVLGLVPGNKKASVVITKTGEKKKFVRLLSAKLKEDEEAKKEAERVAKEQAKAEAEKPAEPEKVEEVVEAAAVEDAPATEPAQTETQTASETVTTDEEAVSTSEDSVADATETVAEEVVPSVETKEAPAASEESAKEGEEK